MKSAITFDEAGPFTPRRLAVAAACAAVAAALWFGVSGTGPDADTSNTMASPAPAVTAPQAAPAGAEPAAAVAAATPADPARLFDLGVAGDLRLDIDTKAALDLIVADLGAHPSAERLATLERSLRAGLPADAATQVIALVHAYRSYASDATASAAAQKPPQSPEEMRQLLAQEAQLRRRHFDATTTQALFGAQEAYSRYSVEAQQIDADTSLSAVEKSRRLHALRSALPPEVAELEPSLSPRESEMNLRIAELRERGATALDVQTVRAEYMGAEAAASLTEMEAQNAKWAARYQSFQQQRDALLATHPADPQGAVDRLLAQHFSPEELPGAKAYVEQQRR